ncbi:PucR family transcriptional regulator [Alteribacillus iranensis]|uniref:Purine catabolism regulatory protein n=1 Tax=Alteribacillus iranensis TaxID=930128 RepID=A0A1I2DJ21_9BACI|nr:PucR family transcriptional regulator [Alteribacillus iranensis]SFE80615.1 purine catabolism regulatory protein [Alteribacillus iranensis]
MTITVRELINNPHLKTTIIAGTTGLENEVTWAHVCELKDPTPWLTGGEIVMTNGLVFTDNEKDQEAYLHLLWKAGASGLAIGKDLHAPELSDGLLLAANHKGFPILLTDYDVPWIAFSKAVSIANSNQDHAQVVQALRIYDIVRESIQNTTPDQIVDKLGEIINCDMYVIDPVNKKPLFNHLNNDLIDNLKDILTSNKSISIRRLKWNGRATVLMSVPSYRPAQLLVISRSLTDSPNNLVLRHVATVAGLVVEKNTTIHERQRRLGSEILAGMIEGQITDEAASILLAEHGLKEGPLCMVVCSADGQPFEHSWLHVHLHAQGIPHLLTYRENVLLVLLPMTEKTLTSLQDELPSNVRMGVSDTLDRISRSPDAYQESLWALRSAETHNKSIVYYREELPISPFLPRNRVEAQQLVDNILGELLIYDTGCDNQMIKTLYIYLRENRSWKSAAQELHIHKQTLVYRIKRIEEITGRDLNNITDVSELWFALQAALHLHLLQDLS